MKILIVEDENLAAKKLEALIKKIIPEYNLIGVCKSIDDAVKVIKTNDIDLGFFDIQIQDGLSLEIFDNVNVDFPIIFTTAYNDYAIRAFKINSIDYLLKPVSKNELQNAINKYYNFWSKTEKSVNYNTIEEIKNLLIGNYKERFTIKIGNKIKIIKTNEIAYFYSLDKATYAKTLNETDNLLDDSLENIFYKLNPKQYFRINRKYIININQITDIYSYSNSRLKVNLKTSTSEDLIVSREKVREFKKWIEQK